MDRTGLLEIFTLGGLSIRLADDPVTGLKSRKVEALLTYLACTGRPQPREVLAELLWEGRTQTQAMSNLRGALANLRKHLNPFVAITRDTAALNPDAKVWLDVADLERRLNTGQIEEAVVLYQGDFLEGFYVRGCPSFEDWASVERERLHHTILDALKQLVVRCSEEAKYQEGIAYASRMLQLDPLMEEAHRQMMQLLAYSGQRGAALEQYTTCRQLLEKELGVEPTDETTALWKQIRSGSIEIPAAGVRSIRDYRLQESIGSGGFGEVYRAYQPTIERTVAIKVILPEYAKHTEFIRRFEREAQLVARLEHPYIVPLYDFWRDSGGAYLVMRWLSGGNLHQSLQQGPWTPRAAARMLDQIGGALATAHLRGVVHRDIKPENILLDQEGNAYLADFGIAKEVLRSVSSTPTGAVPGSLWYISPEQAQGQRVSHQSDIYSLGIVMYEVLTGEHPFSGLMPADQLVRRLTEPFPPLRKHRHGLPAALDDVLQQATAKDSAERYPDATALATAFREAIASPVAPAVTALPGPVEAELDARLTPPVFLQAGVEREPPRRPVFVGRERELDRLSAFLKTALAGKGQLVFVTGGAGRGKTALMWEFARQAMDAHPNLLISGGSCSAYSGIGDPYLPFRELVSMLTGDVEAHWATGAISSEHTERLWNAMPLAVTALMDRGNLLIDTFVSGAALLTRATTAAPRGARWLDRLSEHIGHQNVQAHALEQSGLFQQVTEFLRALAEECPLMLIVDDMQWADTASISLLFHLGRWLANGVGRIFVISAYRPDEVALYRNGAPHPLQRVLAELRRTFGEIWLDLGKVEEADVQSFVRAFLDTEPNRLGEPFRQALALHTGGHPLFVVELLQAMKERGQLIQDEDGRWVEGPVLEWQALPARVEGIVEKRIGQLEPELREILNVASVEGEEFTAQVVAHVQGTSERHILRNLSQELEKRHRLVQERGEAQVCHQRLWRYRFAHTLFQAYLYNELGVGERQLLHRDIAQILEDLYAGRTEEIAVQLGHHYQMAGIPEKAVGYLLEAGDQARALYAHAEAERFYRQAVEILREQGRDELAARTLMKLGLVYTSAFDTDKARGAYAEAFALWQPLQEFADALDPRTIGAVLRFALEQPVTLDPGMMGDDVSTYLATQLFEGLVRVGAACNVLPAVATHWDIEHNGTEYVFHLREGVRWSDGTPVTASDFEYAWKRNLDPASASPVAHLLYPLRNARAFREGEIDEPDEVGVTALNDLTLEVRLESPTAYLPYLLAHTVAYPLPRWAVERYGQAWTEPESFVSNGAYKVSEWEKGKQLVLSRNPRYHGRFPGNVERVECHIFKEYRQALEAYAADSVDKVHMFNADPDIVAQARATFGDELIFIPWPVTFYLILRADKPPFDDVQVRRAFAHAVDREALTKEIFQDQRLPATGGFVPLGMPGHSPGLGLTYDPERARDLLAQAGFPDGQDFPAVTWLYSGGSTDERVIAFLRRSWRQNLGLDLESQSLEWAPFVEQLMRDSAHLTLMGWSADYPDPDNMLRVTFHSKTGITSPRWHNARFDALVTEAQHITDHAKRMELYREADRILVAEEAVIMPLTYGQGRVLLKPRVTYPGPLSVPIYLNHFVVERRDD